MEETMKKRVINTVSTPFKAIYRNRYCRVTLEFLRYLFLPSLVTFLLLSLIEAVFPESVSRYINLNYWLIGVIITGVITALTGTGTEYRKDKIVSIRNDIIPIICFGVVGAGIVWYQTRDLGWPSYIISPVAGILIVLLTLIVWQEPNEEESEDKNSPDC